MATGQQGHRICKDMLQGGLPQSGTEPLGHEPHAFHGITCRLTICSLGDMGPTSPTCGGE